MTETVYFVTLSDSEGSQGRNVKIKDKNAN